MHRVRCVYAWRGISLLDLATTVARGIAPTLPRCRDETPMMDPAQQIPFASLLLRSNITLSTVRDIWHLGPLKN